MMNSHAIIVFLIITLMLFSSAENHQMQQEEVVTSLTATMVDSNSSSQAPVQPPTTTFPTRGAYEGSLDPEECSPRCAMRCSNTQYKKPCLFFCNKCCVKCLCVPPGTYGNKHFCPCYDNWKTKRGGPKCP